MDANSKPGPRPAETTPPVPLTFRRVAANRARVFFRSNTFWVAVGALATTAAILVPIILSWTKEREETADLLSTALAKMDGEFGRIEVTRTCQATPDQRKKAETAKRDLDKANSLRPKSPHVMTALGIYNLKICRLNEAKRLFEQAIQRDGTLAAPHYILGVALWMEGHTLKAIDQFEKARDLNPQDYRILYNLGVVELQSHHPKEAIENLKKASELDPASSEVWENLGTAYSYADQHEEALKAYRTAVQCNPESASAHYNLGRYLWATDRKGEAIEPLTKARETEPESPVALPLLGLSLASVGKQREAIDLLRSCTERWPDNADCYEAYGLILQREGNLSAAISAWKQSVQLDPNDKDTWRYLAEACTTNCRM